MRVVTGCLQEPRCELAALAYLTYRDDGHSPVELCESFGQIQQRDVNGPLDVARLELVSLADVDELRASDLRFGLLRVHGVPS
ncbi:MAG: hypothetical protein QOG54_163 [Actinomycetota bacterium]|nr:hypothetical protein [Actinomycetota bacterium]